MTYEWTPHKQVAGRRRRVVESSGDDAYQLCHETPHYYVTRWSGRLLEETARGSYESAVAAWLDLSGQHTHENKAAS